MTDTINQVRAELTEMLKCAAFVKQAKDIDDYEIRAAQLVRFVDNRAQRLLEALSHPAPGECACPEHGNWIAAGDVNRLVRELDVLLNGEDGAAKQASLCDIVSQVASQHFVLVRRADVPEPTFREIRPEEVTFGRHRDVPSADEDAGDGP
jgi:hypothetical protein